jgi:hypothetical protein
MTDSGFVLRELKQQARQQPAAFVRLGLQPERHML